MSDSSGLSNILWLFSQCVRVRAALRLVGQVFCLHGLGREAEAPEVSGLPSITQVIPHLANTPGFPATYSVCCPLLWPEPGPARLASSGVDVSTTSVSPVPVIPHACEKWPASTPVDLGLTLLLRFLSCDFGQVPSCCWASVFSSVKCGWCEIRAVTLGSSATEAGL